MNTFMKLVKATAAGLLLALGSALASQTASAADAIAVSQHLLQLLDHQQYTEAEALFTPEAAQAIPVERLQQSWESLETKGGALKGYDAPKLKPMGTLSLITTVMHREKLDLKVMTAVTEDGHVSAFSLKRADLPPPAAASDAPYREQALTITTGDKPSLPATLTLPKGTGPFPAVVLVHGSGAQDRYETIGPNRPFLDIARGLAAQGIAVLAYDKRTLVHPEEFVGKDITIDDETTNDAIFAVATLRQQPGIDPHRIFVFGHSQGAMMAPRIAARTPGLAGIVMFGAPARTILTLAAVQSRYLFMLDGKIDADEQAFLDKLDAQIAAIHSDKDLAPADLPFGIPAHYWRDEESIRPIKDAQALQLPILLLHGERDFQVPDADWQSWHQGLAGHHNVSFHEYPAVDHMGLPGSGTPTNTEYTRPGHVDPALIDDVAHWIQQQPATR